MASLPVVQPVILPPPLSSKSAKQKEVIDFGGGRSRSPPCFLRMFPANYARESEQHPEEIK